MRPKSIVRVQRGTEITGGWTTLSMANTHITMKNEQRSKLLLVLASIVSLGWGSRPDSLPNFCLFQGKLCVCKWGLISDEKRDW